MSNPTSKTVTQDLVGQLRGDAAMHRHYGRDWSAELLERAAKEIETLRSPVETTGWHGVETLVKQRNAAYRALEKVQECISHQDFMQVRRIVSAALTDSPEEPEERQPMAWLGFPEGPAPKCDLVYDGTTRLDGYTYRPIWKPEDHPTAVRETAKRAKETTGPATGGYAAPLNPPYVIGERPSEQTVPVKASELQCIWTTGCRDNKRCHEAGSCQNVLQCES